MVGVVILPSSPAPTSMQLKERPSQKPEAEKTLSHASNSTASTLPSVMRFFQSFADQTIRGYQLLVIMSYCLIIMGKYCPIILILECLYKILNLPTNVLCLINLYGIFYFFYATFNVLTVKLIASQLNIKDFWLQQYIQIQYLYV